MEQRRYLLFFLVSMGFFLLWMQIAPALFPQFFPQPQPGRAKPGDPDPQVALDDPADRPDREPPADEPEPDPEQLPEFPHQKMVLGKEGFDQGFLIQAELSTRGAAIEWVQLTDPRYTNLERTDQLMVVGNEVIRNIGGGEVPRTFETYVPEIDDQLKQHGLSLAEVDWEIVRKDATSVTFRYPAPDRRLEVLKTYSLRTADRRKRDASADGYFLDVDLVIRNLSEQPVTTTYDLVGPVGLPIENLENTRLFREVKLATVEKPQRPTSVTPINLTAGSLVSQFEKAVNGGKPVDSWREPIHFAGSDVQFFAALIFPDRTRFDDPDAPRAPEPYFEVVRPILLQKAATKDHSDFTILMESNELKVPPGQEVTHQFKAFFGPKRPELLEPLYAGSVIQFGWFSSIAKLMLIVLGFFHHAIGLSYALSIILLTVVVRGLMVPISRKQVIEAEKMKILAPKLKEIQDKHKGNPEEFAKAYREFQKKHNYHPMIGCLPALLQLPIFIGLYQALFQAIDLRLARFLWIDNLAAPDALFPLGFAVPWFGWTTFNLLPILTVALFVVQQKMFTPPATSPEQEMQYKMMNVMMIVIGVLFYSVPAGLCLYFISSSLWGLTERQLLKKFGHIEEKARADISRPRGGGAGPGPDGGGKGPKKPDGPPKAPGLFERILEAADQAKNQTDGKSPRRFSKEGQAGSENKPGKKKKKSRPRR
jgi:YidC/Oxa1 family membrane protein insertase